MKAETTKLSKRERILQHAAVLFKEQGYAGSSMRELATRVGVEPSTLYSHISGKDELLREICFNCANRFVAGMQHILIENITPVDQLDALIDLHIDMAISDVSSITVFNDEWKHLEGKDLEKFVQMRRNYEQQFTAILKQGVESGFFRKIDERILMYTILSALRWIHYWYKADKTIQPNHIKHEIKTLVLHGLVK